MSKTTSSINGAAGALQTVASDLRQRASGLQTAVTVFVDQLHRVGADAA